MRILSTCITIRSAVCQIHLEYTCMTCLLWCVFVLQSCKLTHRLSQQISASIKSQAPSDVGHQLMLQRERGKERTWISIEYAFIQHVTHEFHFHLNLPSKAGLFPSPGKWFDHSYCLLSFTVLLHSLTSLVVINFLTVHNLTAYRLTSAQMCHRAVKIHRYPLPAAKVEDPAQIVDRWSEWHIQYYTV